MRKRLVFEVADHELDLGVLSMLSVDRVQWRFTRAGLARVEALRRAGAVPDSVSYKERGHNSAVVEVKLRARLLRDARVESFLWEIERDRPKWQGERRAAAAQGRRHYRDWIRDWLEADEYSELAFTDDEVFAAAKYATRRGPVLASEILERLAPGLGTQSREETARLSQVLVRLAKQGRVAHAGQIPGRWLWKVCPHA